MKRFLITFLMVAYSWNSVQANPVPADPIQAMCANTPNPENCVKIVKADPRNDLKTTPEGVATILVDSAEKNVKDTIDFIKGRMPTVKEADVKEKMKGCLQAYEQVGKGLKLKPKQLKTPEDREDAASNIDTAESDISYDCGWEQLKVRTPEANQLSERVAALSDSVDSATTILTAPST